MMIEAAPVPALSGRALRRIARFCETAEPALPASLDRDDLHFFLRAYLGARVFFFAWLA